MQDTLMIKFKKKFDKSEKNSFTAEILPAP